MTDPEKLIAALVKKTGGCVELTEADLEGVKPGEYLFVSREPGGGMTLHVGPSEQTYTVPLRRRPVEVLGIR